MAANLAATKGTHLHRAISSLKSRRESGAPIVNAPGKRSEISVAGTLYATLSCPNRYVILPQRIVRSGSRGGFTKSKIYKVYKHAASRLLSRGTACRVTSSPGRAEKRESSLH